MIQRVYPLLLIFLFTLLFTQCSSKNTVIYVDNYSGRDIVVLWDGEDWLKMKNESSTIQYITPGKHRVHLYDWKSNQKLDSLELNIMENKKHVLNLMGGAVYQSDASIVRPRGEIDIDKLLGGGERIKDKFFLAEQDYVLNEIPKNFKGLVEHESQKKTYLRRIPKAEIATYNFTGDDYWRRENNGMKMEALSAAHKDKVYDIIRSDKVCESFDQLSTLLTNDLSIVREKCPATLQRAEGQTIENWFVDKNRIIQVVLGAVVSDQLSEADEKRLRSYVEKDDFDGYFAALVEIDPQVNDLVAFQARYNRIKRLKANPGKDRGSLQVMENRLKHSMGFKTQAIKQ